MTREIHLLRKVVESYSELYWKYKYPSPKSIKATAKKIGVGLERLGNDLVVTLTLDRSR